MLPPFLLLAIYSWLAPPRQADEVSCDPIIEACFDRRTAVLRTAATLSEQCGETDSLFAAIETHGVAPLSVYAFADRAAADTIDQAFASLGATIVRRTHDGGYLRGTAFVTAETRIAALVALAGLELCPLGLSVVPATIAR